MPWEIFDKKASSASEKARYTKSAPIIKVLISITLKKSFSNATATHG